VRLIMIRHGETDWNKKQLFQGHSDIPLNALGREQAVRAAEHLAGEVLDAIYCSDLSRARETASILAQGRSLTPIPDSRLREINFGAWEGMDFTKIYDQYPKEFEAWYKDTGKRAVPGGESLEQVNGRVLSFIREIHAKYQEGTVAAVTHGGVIKGLLMISFGTSALWKQEISPGSLTYFLVEKGDLLPLQVNVLGE
jgi:alpha-ribazole phosphatase